MKERENSKYLLWSNMLRFLYIILIFINLIIFLTKYKKINYVIIYYFSSVIYYAGAIFGRIYYSYNTFVYSYDVNDNTYIALIINMILILISMFIPEKNIVLNKKKEKAKKENLEVEKIAMTIIFFICIILSTYAILSFNLLYTGSNFNKTELLDNTGTVIEYFKSIVMFAIVYLFTQKNIKYSKKTYILLILCILTTFLLGHRSYIIIAVVAIGYYYYNEKISKNKNILQTILKNYKPVLLSILIIFITFAVKGVTAALFDGNFELVMSRLTSIEYYTDIFKLSEPNVITANLDTIIKNNYKINFSSYPMLITLIIPFISRYIPYTSFTYVYQDVLFNGASNRASTFIGEAFANGGMVCVGLIIAIILLLLKFVNTKTINCNNNIIRTFLLISGIDLSFYIHRNSLDYAFIRIRSYVYIIILIYVLKMILANSKIIKGKVKENKNEE